jgi:hypothetical protein
MSIRTSSIVKPDQLPALVVILVGFYVTPVPGTSLLVKPLT